MADESCLMTNDLTALLNGYVNDHRRLAGLQK
jgi:hypothetical protein